MGVKLILLDLDGTLLNSDKLISDREYSALERAHQMGVHIVPSTGRFFAGMPKVVRDLPFVRYAITVNGAEVYDVQAEKAISRAEIPWKQADEVYARLDTFPVIYDCFQDGWGYMDAELYARIDEFIADPRVNRMVRELRKPVTEFRKTMAVEQKPVQKIQMFFTDQQTRLATWETLKQEFPELTVTSSISNNVELNAKLAHKGEALRRLCDHLGISIEETMAFGDGPNDCSMIETAGIGVAMDNACPELKQVADYITDTNDNFGVAKAIERFCLNP